MPLELRLGILIRRNLCFVTLLVHVSSTSSFFLPCLTLLFVCCLRFSFYCYALRSLQVVSAPLNVDACRGVLNNHPDRRFAMYLMTGLTKGFCIGFDRQHHLSLAGRTLLSVTEQSAFFTHYLERSSPHGDLLDHYHTSQQHKLPGWELF